MSVDVKDWVTFATEQGASYFEWLGNSLLHPSYIALRVSEWSKKQTDSGTTGKEDFISDQVPIFPFLIISLFIGATIGALIPGRPPMKDRTTVVIVVIILWMTVALVISPFIRVLGGKGSVSATVQVILQLLSVAYVVSNTIVFLVEGAFSVLSSGGATFGNPGDLILGVQVAVLLLYFPVCLNKVHGIAALSLSGLLISLIFVATSFTVGGIASGMHSC